MVEKSVRAGDFDMRSRGPKSETRNYWIHGLPFVVFTTVLVVIADLVFDTLSSLMNLIIISIFDAPDIIISPYASSVIFFIFLIFGLIALAFAYGGLNRYLTERIWHEKQNRRLDRQIGLGTLLIGFLLMVHLPMFPFYVLWINGFFIEQIVFFIIYILVVSLLDGIIAKWLASLDLG